MSGFAGGRAQGSPAARDTSGFDDNEPQRARGSISEGKLIEPEGPSIHPAT